MNHLGVIGTSHKVRSVKEIARYHLGGDPTPQLTRLKAALDLEDLLLLSTCNRVEFWYRAAPEADGRAIFDGLMGFYQDALGSALNPDDFYQLERGEAARHLMRVSASLDSLVVGEIQILEQLKAAHARALDARLAGAGITRLLEIAYQAVKEIRRDTRLTEGLVSVASLAAVEVLAHHEETPRVLLIGAGETMAEAGTRLKDNPTQRPIRFLVTNRTASKAAALAERLEGEALPWAEVFAEAPSVHAVMIATSAPSPVLTRAALTRLIDKRVNPSRPLLVLDLSQPSDVAAADLPGLKVVSIEDLRARAEDNLQARREQALLAERIIEGKLTLMERRLADQVVGPAVGMIQRRFSAMMTREVHHLIEHQLTGLNADQIAQLERWAASTAKRLAGIHLEHAKRMLVACSHCPPEAPCLAAMGLKNKYLEDDSASSCPHARAHG
ncbi:hypothetical protein KKF91_15440 [Myxococcota bacterium]|nr:hypothetical protein [Myxococcota bacterium]MBU1431934.1 hypothetical protein [Myxococcota bacterium]MBU1896356.1 hypothetical protein [Myxococcota bacterium]